MKILQGFAVAFALLAFTSPLFAASPSPHLVPTPKQLKLFGGTLPLKPDARIVAAANELKPLAEVLRGDLVKLTGLNMTVAEGAGQPGDIVLAIDASLNAGAERHWPHNISVSDRVDITGGDYNAVAMGTATLLQMLEIGEDGVRVPRLSIHDWSAAEYPGLMLDVARQNNTLQDVRRLHRPLPALQGALFPIAPERHGERHVSLEGLSQVGRA